MAMNNSILFDSSSIIDIETSLFIFLLSDSRLTEGISEVINIDEYNRIRKIIKDHTYNIGDIKYDRINYPYGLLRRILKPMSLADYLSLRDTLCESLKELMFKKNGTILTRAKTLIAAYKKAGNGIIATSILCKDAIEKQLLQRYIDCEFIIGEAQDIPICEKYSQIISGDFRNLLKFKYTTPMNITMLNFRENFLEDDITIPRPELVITLGDIHDIKVMEAYTSSDFEMSAATETIDNELF